MQQPADVPDVHSWDVEHRRVRCGARENVRSTKHRAGVTCPECLRALSEPEPVAAAQEQP
jgi:hypothetical protein